jgi:hypothetical protein
MDTHDRDRGGFAPDSEAGSFDQDELYSAPYPLNDYASIDFEPSDTTTVSGTELRRRLITPEALAAAQADEPRPSLVERVIKRLRGGR